MTLIEMKVLTCDTPRWTEAVSDIYMTLPSGDTTNMKPSRVWKHRNERVRYFIVLDCTFTYLRQSKVD